MTLLTIYLFIYLLGTKPFSTVIELELDAQKIVKITEQSLKEFLSAGKKKKKENILYRFRTISILTPR